MADHPDLGHSLPCKNFAKRLQRQRRRRNPNNADQSEQSPQIQEIAPTSRSPSTHFFQQQYQNGTQYRDTGQARQKSQWRHRAGLPRENSHARRRHQTTANQDLRHPVDARYECPRRLSPT